MRQELKHEPGDEKQEEVLLVERLGLAGHPGCPTLEHWAADSDALDQWDEAERPRRRRR